MAVCKRHLLYSPDERIEVMLEQMLENANGDGHSQILVGRASPLLREHPHLFGSLSMNCATAIIACQRGSMSPSGEAVPGRIASAFEIAS
jgi:hypothetical protein